MKAENRPTASRTIRLRDGRALGYEEVGSPGGRPVFFFHGIPQCRLMVRPLSEAAERYGGRLIGVDRPGIGLSDFKPQRTIADWPDDVVELSDALGLDRFGIIATSTGTPYALACGWRIPERVSGVFLAAAFGPMQETGATEGMSREMRRFFGLARRAPALLDPLMKALAYGIRRSPSRTADRLNRNLPPIDAPRDTEEQAMRIAVIAECFRQGTKGARHDVSLACRPWGFAPGDVTVPVTIWHGQQDVIHPPAMATRLAETLPRSELHLMPGSGAYVGRDHVDEIAKVLAS